MHHNYVAVPGIELSVSQSPVSQTRCHCHCVSHSSDSLTQSERCSHTYHAGTGNCNFTLSCVKDSC